MIKFIAMKNLLLTFGIILISINFYAQAPQVSGTNPVSQTLIATPTQPIIVTFDQPINEATVTSSTFQVFGRWSGPMEGMYSFESGSTVVKFTPLRGFFYGEAVRVGLSNGIQNTSGEPLTNGYGFSYWTKSLPASMDLIYAGQIDMRLPGEGQITCYGAYAGDVNDDEHSDLTVVVEDSDDIRVLLSDGDTGYEPFVVFELPPIQGPSTNEGADFNHDGLIDIAIGSTYSDQVNIFMGDATTLFGTPVGYQTGEGVRGLTVADLNGDGWEDIVTANRFASTISILMNDGSGLFEPAVNMETGVDGETTIAATDLDNDGDMDLLVGAYSSNMLMSLLNDGTGNFSVHDTSTSNGGPWMIAIGDVDGDGIVDAALANSLTHSIAIIRTDGSGGLEFDAYYPVDTFPVAIDLGDIDGDGDLDFISSNVNGPNFTLMENDGSGNFINPRVFPAPAGASCATIHDRNNDGAMDITMIDEAEDIVLLYNNSMGLGNDESTGLDSVSVYPNPFLDTIIVGGFTQGPIELTLYDVHGRTIFTRLQEHSNRFDLGHLGLAQGLYIAELFHNGNSQTIKLYKKARN